MKTWKIIVRFKNGFIAHFECDAIQFPDWEAVLKEALAQPNVRTAIMRIK